MEAFIISREVHNNLCLEVDVLQTLNTLYEVLNYSLTKFPISLTRPCFSEFGNTLNLQTLSDPANK